MYEKVLQRIRDQIGIPATTKLMFHGLTQTANITTVNVKRAGSGGVWFKVKFRTEDLTNG